MKHHLATIQQNLQEAMDLLTAFSRDEHQLKCMVEAAAFMIQAIQQGNKIIACGNGGSHCDAMHFAEELSGRFREDRKPLPAMAISDPSYLSCVSNDYGYEHVFSRFVQAFGKPGDILLAISTSGNSLNVCQAAQVAQKQGMHVIALAGHQGGQLKEAATLMIHVPHGGYADRIQEMHIKIIHILILMIEKSL